jgi:uncharacterized iron-regulated membrane protein
VAKINWRIWMRKSHRWGAVCIALPFLLVIGTGILLQLKKESSWIQPPMAKGTGKTPHATFDDILEAAKSVPEAEVKSWDDVDRLDARPDRNMAKVQAKNRWEIQVDLGTGEVLQKAYRRSDTIEMLHDGSWFSDSVKLYVFLPVAFVVLGLWITGIYLFVLPYSSKWWKRRRKTPSVG